MHIDPLSNNGRGKMNSKIVTQEIKGVGSSQNVSDQKWSECWMNFLGEEYHRLSWWQRIETVQELYIPERLVTLLSNCLVSRNEITWNEFIRMFNIDQITRNIWVKNSGTGKVNDGKWSSFKWTKYSPTLPHNRDPTFFPCLHQQIREWLLRLKHLLPNS